MALNRERRSSSVGSTSTPRGLSDSPRTPRSADSIFKEMVAEVSKHMDTSGTERQKCKEKIVNLFAQLFELNETSMQYQLRTVIKEDIAGNTMTIADIQRLIFILKEPNTKTLLATKFAGIHDDHINDFIHRIEKTTYPYQLVLEIDAGVFSGNVLNLFSNMLNSDGSLTQETIGGIEKISDNTGETIQRFKKAVADIINNVSRPEIKSADYPRRVSRFSISGSPKCADKKPLVAHPRNRGGLISSRNAGDSIARQPMSASTPSIPSVSEHDSALEKSHSLPAHGKTRSDSTPTPVLVEETSTVEQLKTALENGNLAKALRLFEKLLDRHGSLTHEAINDIAKMVNSDDSVDIDGMISFFKKNLLAGISQIGFSGKRVTRSESPRPAHESPSSSPTLRPQGSPRTTSDRRSSRPKLVLTSRVQDVKSLLKVSQSSPTSSPAPSPVIATKKIKQDSTSSLLDSMKDAAPVIPSIVEPETHAIRSIASEKSENSGWLNWSYDEDNYIPSSSEDAVSFSSTDRLYKPNTPPASSRGSSSGIGKSKSDQEIKPSSAISYPIPETTSSGKSTEKKPSLFKRSTSHTSGEKKLYKLAIPRIELSGSSHESKKDSSHDEHSDTKLSAPSIYSNAASSDESESKSPRKDKKR